MMTAGFGLKAIFGPEAQPKAGGLTWLRSWNGVRMEDDSVTPATSLLLQKGSDLLQVCVSSK